MNIGRIYPEMTSMNVKEVQKRLSIGGVDLGDCMVAGGAIRDLLTDNTIKDIDIFGTIEAVKNFIIDNARFITNVSKSPIGHTNCNLRGCPYPVQIIVTECAENPRELLADFDINMCRFALSGDKIYYDRNALMEARNKELNIASFHTPYLTLTRLGKYVTRGYKVEQSRYRCLLNTFRKMDEDQYQKELEAVKNFEYDGAFSI